MEKALAEGKPGALWPQQHETSSPLPIPQRVSFSCCFIFKILLCVPYILKSLYMCRSSITIEEYAFKKKIPHFLLLLQLQISEVKAIHILLMIFPDFLLFVYTHKLFVFTNSAFSRRYVKPLTKDSCLVETNKLPIHTVTRMSTKNSRLSEKRLIQTSTYYIIPFI